LFAAGGRELGGVHVQGVPPPPPPPPPPRRHGMCKEEGGAEVFSRKCTTFERGWELQPYDKSSSYVLFLPMFKPCMSMLPANECISHLRMKWEITVKGSRHAYVIFEKASMPIECGRNRRGRQRFLRGARHVRRPKGMQQVRQCARAAHVCGPCFCSARSCSSLPERW